MARLIFVAFLICLLIVAVIVGWINLPLWAWILIGVIYVAGMVLTFIVVGQMPVTPALAILRSILWPFAIFGLVPGEPISFD